MAAPSLSVCHLLADAGFRKTSTSFSLWGLACVPHAVLHLTAWLWVAWWLQCDRPISFTERETFRELVERWDRWPSGQVFILSTRSRNLFDLFWDPQGVGILSIRDSHIGGGQCGELNPGPPITFLSLSHTCPNLS